MSGSRARQIARPVPVVLFKTPTEPLASDSYQLRLTEAGYSPIFVNVLAERWLTEKLVGILLEGNGRHRGELERKQEWEGVVITSRRGAEGWVQAARKAASWSEKGSSQDWSNVPLFTVGTTSPDTLRESDAPQSFLPDLDHVISAKSAALLAPLIRDRPPRYYEVTLGDSACVDNRVDPVWVTHHGEDDVYGPYLIIRGDKSLEEISNRLREMGRRVLEVIVYETAVQENLGQDLEEVGRQLVSGGESGDDLANGHGGVEAWLGFFSPSSAGMVLPHLRKLRHLYGQLPTKHASDGSEAAAIGASTAERKAERNRGLRVFAIGESTGAYLWEQRLPVEVVAREPTAEGVVQALRGCP